MASLLMTPKLNSFSESTPTVPMPETPAKSSSWTPPADASSRSAARPSLHQRWEGFIGEGLEEGQNKPIFSVRRSSIIGRSSVTVEVYNNTSEEFYQIEGSFACRNCTVFNPDKETVAEIRRKVDCTTNVVLGKDVFSLYVKAGFDCAFAMGLVLVLDRLHDGGGDDNEEGENGVDVENPTTENSII
ncbi:hypothetical protein ACJIZ3_020250 [Penstemon smallii]|uniref:Uncharacterized protein n=1 Tax=Penstemon smallii TaxID=265156 RepID=A0ABD3SIK4_9LAMI